MLAAAAAWDRLAQELNNSAAAYRSIVAAVTTDVWRGPSSAMMANAAAPYLSWMHGTAAQADQTATQIKAAAAAYELALAAIVPPAVIAANRAHLLMLVATNFFGQNSPAIATAEADYEAMWAQDTAVMHAYAASSAAASKLTPFTGPAPITSTAGAAGAQSAAAAQSVNTSAQVASPTLFSATDVFNDTVSSLSGAASVSSSSFGGASIGTANHAISINAERDAAQGFGPFLGVGVAPPIAAPATATTQSSVTALTGRASIAGALSVPQAWAATVTPPPGPAAAIMPAAGPATPASAAALQPGMLGETMLGTLAGRGVSNAAAKLRRQSVIPRSPAAG